MERVKDTMERMQQKGEIPREIKNPAEKQLFKELTSQGWEVTKRGWPDFACFNGDKVALIEVKPNRNQHLKRQQYRLMVALAKLGVKCFRWSPDGGFVPIMPTVLDISKREQKKIDKGIHPPM